MPARALDHADPSVLLAQIHALTDPPLRRCEQEPMPPHATSAARPTTVPTTHTLYEGQAQGLSVVLKWDPDVLAVEIGSFEVAWERDDEDAFAELLDLVAATLFGRVRIIRHQVRGEVIVDELQFERRDVGAGWFTWQRRRGPRRFRWPWQRGSAIELRNALKPARGVVLGESATVPSAPWVGTLASQQAAASPAQLVVDGELDLHPFPPKEVGPLVTEYIEAATKEGITRLRLVHGKGIGNLRRTVHAVLDRHPAVASYRLGGHGEGSWGATIVTLHPGPQE